METNVSARVSRARVDMARGATIMAWTILCAGHAVDDEINLE